MVFISIMQVVLREKYPDCSFRPGYLPKNLMMGEFEFME